jgi:large subunit ribosomal protein L31
MKKQLHPQYYHATFTDLSSGKKFKIGSTLQEATVEISSASHPFYTGEERIIDTENRVDSFNRRKTTSVKLGAKVQNKKVKQLARRQKTEKVNANKEITLRDMLKKL